MSFRRRLSDKSGFTLIELLIVVAIIGVLSAVGIPTFKKMVSRSKQSEAKVILGSLYTMEQAFQTEYGLFGNDLDKMGYSNPNTATYTVGFPTTGCASITLHPALGAPAVASISGYATAGDATYYNSKLGAATKCTAGTTADGTFLASASGPITTGAGITSDMCDGTAAKYTAGCQDGWTLDHARAISNAAVGAY